MRPRFKRPGPAVVFTAMAGHMFFDIKQSKANDEGVLV